MTKKTVSGRSIGLLLFLLGCTFITALNASDNPFYVGVKLRDSSVFTYIGKVILQGGMPYRDTFDHKGPLIYLINALGLAINERIGVWLIEFVTVFVILLAAYRLARLLECSERVSRIAVALTALASFYYFNWGNVTEEYACAFILLSLYIFTKYFQTEQVSAAELALCGCSFAAVCLLRINMAALWAVMCIGVLVHCIRKHEGKQLIRIVLWFLAGAAVLTAPVLVWLIRGGAFNAFIQDYFVFNILYSKGSVLHKLNVFAVFCSQAASVLTAAPLLYFWLKERKAIDGLCLLSALLTLAVMSMAGQNYQHYGLILIPLFAYSAGRTGAAISGMLSKKVQSTRRIWIVTIAGALLLMFAQSFVSFAAVALPTPLKSENLANDKKIAEIIQAHTEPEDRISVCGNNDRIYLLADRESASVYSYQYPVADVDPKIKEEYIADMQAMKAKVIVMDHGEEAENFMEEDLAEILRQNYTLTDSVGMADIWVRK